MLNYYSYSQTPSDSNSKVMTIEEAKKLNGWSEPTINGIPYSQYKAEQEALKKKQLEEAQKAKNNNAGPSTISRSIDKETGNIIETTINSDGSTTSNLIENPQQPANPNAQMIYSDPGNSGRSLPDVYSNSFTKAFGDFAALKNTGFFVNAIGIYAAYENSGFEVNAIGSEAGFCNTHNYVNIIGAYRADSPQDEATILTGDLFLRDPDESGEVVTGNSIFFNSSQTARIWYDKSAGEIKVTDNSGNSTTISPHNFSLIKPSEEMAWSFYSVNEEKGKQVNVDMMKVIRLLEQLTGEKLVYISDLEGQELDEQIQKVSSMSDRISQLETENKELKVLLNQLLDEMKKNKK